MLSVERRDQTSSCHKSLRARARISSQSWRSDLVQIWPIRLSKTAGIASYFEEVVRLRRKHRSKSQIRLWRGWAEVADPPSFWRAEMPKCEVVFARALRTSPSAITKSISTGDGFCTRSKGLLDEGLQSCKSEEMGRQGPSL